MQLTYKFRISDTAASELNRQSRAVNYVWNYCNDVQKQALKCITAQKRASRAGHNDAQLPLFQFQGGAA